MISYVGGESELGASVAIPAHVSGDLILIFAYRTGVSAPPPSLPSGWNEIHSGGSGLNCARIAYRIADSNATMSGTWAGAAGIIALVYRAEKRWKTPRVAVNGNIFSSSTMTYPDLSASGSWYVRFAGNRTAENMDLAVPGWTPRAGKETRVRSMDSNGVVNGSANSVGTNTQRVNTAVSWRTATVALGELTDPEGDMADVEAKIPSSGTVFTLSGLNFNLYNDMPQKFKGKFSASPYTMKQIKYPASLDNDSVSTGVSMLDTALLASTGDVLVMGQSQGAQVCSAWMDQYDGDPTREALASRVTFLLTGNPIRATGGELIGKPVVGGGNGVATRTDTVWPVVDFARRYDGWADPPQDRTSQVAVANAKLGKNVFHTAYDEVDLFDPTHNAWTVGNTTFVLTRETPPIYSKMKRWPANVLDWVAYKIEEAYDRVGEEPLSEPPEPPNFFWSAMIGAVASK